MAQIHSTAIIGEDVVLGSQVSLGPYAIVEDGVEIGSGCSISAHAVIKRGTCLGSDNVIAEGVVLGGLPQHLRMPGKVGDLLVGDGNCFRENVTVHRGLKAGEVTRIGNGNMLMVNSHVAHDCVLGDQTIIANNAMIAGHVTIADKSYVSGAVGIHQFCRIGRLAMLGGQARVTQDVPPFMTVDGHSNQVVGLNLVGLRRAGLERDAIAELKAAYRILYRGAESWEKRLIEMHAQFPTGVGHELFCFVQQTQRGIVQDRRGPRVVKMPTTPTAQPRWHRKAG